MALYVKRQHNTKVLTNKTMAVENVYECITVEIKSNIGKT